MKEESRPSASQLSGHPWVLSNKQCGGKLGFKKKLRLGFDQLVHCKQNVFLDILTLLVKIVTSPESSKDKKLISCLMMTSSRLLTRETCSTIFKLFNIPESTREYELYLFAKEKLSEVILIAAVVTMLSVNVCYWENTDWWKIYYRVELLSDIFKTISPSDSELQQLLTSNCSVAVKNMHLLDKCIRDKCHWLICAHEKLLQMQNTIHDYNGMIATCEYAIHIFNTHLKNLQLSKIEIRSIRELYDKALAKTGRLNGAKQQDKKVNIFTDITNKKKRF